MLRLLFRISAVSLGIAFLAPHAAAQSVDVFFTPAAPVQGDLIEVKIVNNNSTFGILLPSSCAYTSIHPVSCSNPPILTPFCLDQLSIIPPGGSYLAYWDGKDESGSVVPPGVYAFSILGMCPTVTISGPCSTPPSKYGVAGHGSAFYEPRLETAGGMPVAGNSSFAVSLAFGLGGAPAWLLAGIHPAAIAAPFGTVYVSLATPFVALPFVLTGPAGVPGAGMATIPLPVPPDPALLGLSLYMQALVADPGGKAGVAHSAGLSFSVCPN